MKMIASDIDNTLTFSNKYMSKTNLELVCVEKINGEDFGYISKNAFQELENLKKEALVVPVTTRSVEQFERIKLGDFEYAITSNGGKIFKNGIEIEEWSRKTEKEIEKIGEFFYEVIDFMSKFNEYFNKEFRCVDGVFYYSKFVVGEKEIDEVLEYLEKNLDKNNWIYTVQNLKLYIIPKNINKENAVKYLKEVTSSDILICTGDGKLDLGFLKCGDVAVVLEGSEVLKYIDFEYKSVPKYYEGTYEMLKFANKY